MVESLSDLEEEVAVEVDSSFAFVAVAVTVTGIRGSSTELMADVTLEKSDCVLVTSQETQVVPLCLQLSFR